MLEVVGGGAFGYPLELSVFSAFPLAPVTTVGMGFPTEESFVVSSFTLAPVAKKSDVNRKMFI